MYLDLDPRRWPVAAPLHKHPLVTTLFEGIDRETEQTFAEEYKVDEEPAAVEIPLVYEADSCQHSALIDAMQGKNLVIEGPPGTGKSQTITNLIAAVLTKGKTVLFISEKLAALEVVRRRLDQAHLGSFCLELHSHKTQKKRLLDDIKLRMDRTFSDPYHLDKKIAELEDKRKRLNRYAHLINSVSNNDLGLTINQILWAAEHYRIVLKENAHIFTAVELPDAPKTNAEQLSYMEEAINQLSGHLKVIGDYGSSNPWWGFFPHLLLFDDDEAVATLLRTLAAAAKNLASYLTNAEEKFKVPLPQKREETAKLWAQMNKFPEFAGDEAFDLLPNILSKDAIDVVGDFESKAKFIQDKELEVQKCLLEPTLITDEVIQQARSMLKIARELNQDGTPHPEIQKRAMGLSEIRSDLDGALAYFLAASVAAGIKVSPTQQGFALINAVMRVAREVPLNLLKLRRPEFMEVGISEAIQNASKQAYDLKAERSKIEDLFVISALPPRAEIVGALRTFLSSGDTFRFFSRRWRAAKRLYRSIRRERHWFLKPEKCTHELSELITFLEARFKFEHSPDIKRIAGEWFDGIDTDFTKFERLAKWYELTRNELIPFVTPEGKFRLKDVFELPEDKLEWLKSRAADAERHWSAILGANSCFESIFNTEDKPSHICFGPTINLEMLNAQVSETATKMKSIAEFFKKLCLPPESPVTATNLLDDLVRTRRLKMELEANQEAKHYLGVHYKGLETNFGPIHSVIKCCKKIEDIGLPAPILNWLLTPEALNRVSTLNEVAKVSDEKWQHIELITNGFNRYGTFDWKEWHRGAEITPVTIQARANEAINALPVLMEWADLSRAIHKTTALGLAPLCQHALKGEIEPIDLLKGFRYCFHNSIAKSVMRNNPEMMQFSGLSHNQIKERFIELDQEVISLTGERCAARIVKRPVPFGVKYGPVKDYTERALLEHEINKKKRHIPIRQLVRRAGHALQALKPCFMMGPLSVSQYLEPGVLNFDLIVMDEASQLKPEDALGAIARGKQVVVVGDPRQLPPTTFFDHLSEDTWSEDEDVVSATESMESILDICQFLFQPVRRLCWHYRSQHHSLISFSNRHFYRDRPLIVFPSPYGPHNGLGIRYHYVSDAVYENRCNHQEARRVADAVIGHMREHPEESLGVATLNITQCDLIEEEVNKRLKLYEQAQTYLDRWEKESFPFFIKNLENVQGDERDVIFISTTFGKNPQGVVRNQFGPINRQMGWRRLNVLVTRARRRIELFTSMEPEDIRIDPSSSLGVQALKNYLAFAKSGQTEAPEITSREPDSDFEIAVAEILGQKGYEVVPQLGVAGFFIDIGVRNPERQGEFLAAIECDGVTYHSGLSARDRDRLRQQVLEGLGWKGKIYRIWSIDWFKDPRQQTKRLLDFLEHVQEKARLRAAEAVAKASPGELEVSPASKHEQLPIEPKVVLSETPSLSESMVVEIWDYVTYCDVEHPEDHKAVQIVEGHTDTDKGVVGENAPLARTLLGAEVGDEVEMNVPGRTKRRLRILKIER